MKYTVPVDKKKTFEAEVKEQGLILKYECLLLSYGYNSTTGQ